MTFGKIQSAEARERPVLKNDQPDIGNSFNRMPAEYPIGYRSGAAAAEWGSQRFLLLALPVVVAKRLHWKML